MSAVAAPSVRLRVLWDANRELLDLRNRLEANGLTGCSKKVDSALRSVSIAFDAAATALSSAAIIAKATGGAP